MTSHLKMSSPWMQAACLQLGAGLLALGLAYLHPARKTVAELSSISSWRVADLARFSQPVIRVRPSTSATVDETSEFVFTSVNWDTQVESLSGRFHGQEWIVVDCQTPGCEEGWALAKRLRRYGFPHVALLQREGKP